MTAAGSRKGGGGRVGCSGGAELTIVVAAPFRLPSASLLPSFLPPFRPPFGPLLPAFCPSSTPFHPQGCPLTPQEAVLTGGLGVAPPMRLLGKGQGPAAQCLRLCQLSTLHQRARQ